MNKSIYAYVSPSMAVRMSGGTQFSFTAFASLSHNNITLHIINNSA